MGKAMEDSLSSLEERRIRQMDAAKAALVMEQPASVDEDRADEAGAESLAERVWSRTKSAESE